MKKVTLTVLLGLFATMASAQFNPTPVTPREGYAQTGEGLHSGVPFGREGVDCVNNPVSLTVGRKTVSKTELVPGDIISIPVTVLFDFDGDVVRPDGETALRGFYQALVDNGVEEINIVGHTDSKGTEAYNDALGLRRAVAVGLVIALAGFNEDAITVASAGELDPKVPNSFEDGTDDPEGRQQNRRVDIEIVAVKDKEVTTTEVVEVDKNPQVFHRLGSNGTVSCAGGGSVGVGIAVGGRGILNGNGGIVIAVPR